MSNKKINVWPDKFENHCLRFVNHQRLKHVGLHFQICWHGNPSQERSAIGQLTSGSNPYQSCRRMVWPSPLRQRRMLYSPRCHRRIPQATSGLTHASQEVFRKCISQLHIKVSQFLPHLKKWAYLRLEILNLAGLFSRNAEIPSLRSG